MILANFKKFCIRLKFFKKKSLLINENDLNHKNIFTVVTELLAHLLSSQRIRMFIVSLFTVFKSKLRESYGTEASK